MPATWKTVPVFISSTFRDMHAERDWLVKRVFPALREWLQQYRIHLVDIDLRWGVTQTGKSVTELEILYGVLRDPQMHGHGMFFFRDPAFIDDVPEAKQADLRAEDGQSAKKLAALKQAIRDTDLPFPPLDGYACRYAGLRINWQLASRELAAQADREALRQVAEDGIVARDEYAGLDERLRPLVHRFGVVHLTGPLATRLMAKGNATHHGTLRRNACTKTKPNVQNRRFRTAGRGIRSASINSARAGAIPPCVRRCGATPRPSAHGHRSHRLILGSRHPICLKNSLFRGISHWRPVLAAHNRFSA